MKNTPPIKTYIELSHNLDRTDRVDEILIMSFYQDKLLLMKKGKTFRFPIATFEPGESLEKTVRRDLYERTGALLRTGKLLGLLRFEHANPRLSNKDKEIPIYVCTIYHFESPVLKNEYKKHLCDIGSAYQKLRQPYWEKVKAYLFYHAYKLYREMEMR